MNGFPNPFFSYKSHLIRTTTGKVGKRAILGFSEVKEKNEMMKKQDLQLTVRMKFM